MTYGPVAGGAFGAVKQTRVYPVKQECHYCGSPEVEGRDSLGNSYCVGCEIDGVAKFVKPVVPTCVSCGDSLHEDGEGPARGWYCDNAACDLFMKTQGVVER